MPVPYQPSQTDFDRIMMVVRETNRILRSTGYDFNETFLTPTSGFHFSVGGFTREDLAALGMVPGARVSLRIGPAVVGDGYIDSIEVSADRQAGTIARLEGRDRLAYTVDAHAPPKQAFKEGMTLESALQQLFTPFGFTRFEVTDVDLRTGNVSGTKFSKGGKKGPRPLKSFVLHQTQPNPGEGVFAFAQRIVQRHGLWLWLSADGETIIVSRPDYSSEPRHRLVRALDGRGTNVLDGAVKFDVGEQPTIIIADGLGGGGEFGSSRLRAKCVNPTCTTDDPELRRLWDQYKGAVPVPMTAVGTPMRVSKSRALFLHDQSSQTLDQLQNFVRREMSLFVRKSLQATYTVEGHGQDRGGGFVPWAVNTMVDVHDDVAGLREKLWVIGRTFSQSRSGGTTTRIELARPHSLELGEPEAVVTSEVQKSLDKKPTRKAS